MYAETKRMDDFAEQDAHAQTCADKHSTRRVQNAAIEASVQVGGGRRR
jgi:hypothetical protein